MKVVMRRIAILDTAVSHCNDEGHFCLRQKAKKGTNVLLVPFAMGAWCQRQPGP